MSGKSTILITEKAMEYVKQKGMTNKPICEKHVKALIPIIYRAMVDVLAKEGHIESIILGNFKVNYMKLPPWMQITSEKKYIKVARFKSSPHLKRNLKE